MNYTDENRGKVQHDERMKQPLLFDGMRYGNITPTDIDACTEYHDRFFMVFEVKKCGAEMSAGQKLFYERMADRIEKGGADALIVEVTHNIQNSNFPVLLRDARVKRVYWKGKWKNVSRNVNAGTAFNESMEWAKNKEAKHDTL